MTDIKNSQIFNVDNIRKVTDVRNLNSVDLTITLIWYPGYSIFREQYSTGNYELIGNILRDLAISYETMSLWLLRGTYERYLSSILDEDYADMMLDNTIYDKHFTILRGCKLSYKLFYKDILYVYKDGRVLVSNSLEAKKAFRDIRGIK